MWVVIGAIVAVFLVIGYGLREYILSIFVGGEPDDIPYPLEKKG